MPEFWWMPEYHTLRAVLALGAAALAWRHRHTSARVIPGYWTAQAIALAIPNALWTEWFKAGVQIPRECLITVLAGAVTAEAVWMTLAPRAVRRALLGWSTALAVAVVLVGWKWCPERAFQAVMIGRQYVMLVVALAGTAALAWTRWMRPTPTVLDGWWTAWLWTLVALAITTKGGLLWSVAEWRGGLQTWRVVSDAALTGQLGLIGWRLIHTRRTERAEG